MLKKIIDFINTVKRNKNGTFAKGLMKGNKTASGNKPNKISFKKCQYVLSKHLKRKGVIRDDKGTWLTITVGKGKVKGLGRYIYEKNNGTIPKGYIVYHKDGDRFNNNISNLDIITRKELCRRNFNR